jgi:hypothetical protein
VLLALAPRLVEAADGEDALRPAPALGVDLLLLPLEADEADAGDARVHAREVFGDHGAAQAHGLEVEAAAVGGDHRDAHLGHDLEEPRVDGRAVAAHGVHERAVEKPALDAVADAVLREIGVHRGRAAGDQHREVVRVDAFRAAEVERGEGPQALAGEPAVHRRGGEDHGEGHPRSVLMLVGKDQVARARAHGVLGLGADALEPLPQGVGTGLEGAVDQRDLRAELLHHHVELGVGDERRLEDQDLGLRGVLVEHVLEVAEAGLQRHHPPLPEGVDGRVRDLREVLAEVVAQRPVLGRQHGGGRVVAHAGHHFLAVLGHGRQDLLQLLDRVARGDLAPAQLLAREQGPLGHVAQERVEVHDLLDPLREGLRRG